MVEEDSTSPRPKPVRRSTSLRGPRTTSASEISPCFFRLEKARVEESSLETVERQSSASSQQGGAREVPHCMVRPSQAPSEETAPT